MTKKLLVVVTLACSGCAWVFMQKPLESYESHTEPQCSDSAGWAAVDGVFAVLNILGVILVSSDDMVSDEDKSSIVLGGIGWTALHLASAGTGAGWASKCKAARAEFYAQGSGGLTPAEEQRLRQLRELRTAQERKEPKAVVEAGPPKTVVVPRGFFCSSNATANFCVRDKAECQRTRDISISALPDLSECTLVEIAWCFGDRCTTTEESCVVQLARAVEGGQLHSECAEAR